MEEIGKILPNLFKLQLSCLEPPVVEVLAPFWPRVAGKALARQCRPMAFRTGTLTLATDNPDWAAPIEQMGGEIRAKINKFLGKPVVKNIKVLRVRKPGHDDASRRLPASPPVSGLIRKIRPGTTAPRFAQVAGRPHAKHSGRESRRVY